MRLSPDEHVTADALEHGKRFLVRDAAWASLAGSLQGGVVLVGFALALGAGPMQIGLLAAIPLMAQALQLPAIALVERLQQRRKIAVVAVTAARVLILSMALLPWVADQANRLHLLIAMQFCISALGSVCACALNSWLHQLLPRDGLGAFFAKRLFWATSVACIGTLAAGQLIDRWPFEPALYAYSVSFAAAALAGFMSSWALARVPEPRMVSHPHGILQLRHPCRRLDHRVLRGRHGRGQHRQRRRSDGQSVEHGLDARADRGWWSGAPAVHQRLLVHPDVRADDLAVEHRLRQQHLQARHGHGCTQAGRHRRHLLPDRPAALRQRGAPHARGRVHPPAAERLWHGPERGHRGGASQLAPYQRRPARNRSCPNCRS